MLNIISSETRLFFNNPINKLKWLSTLFIFLLTVIHFVGLINVGLEFQNTCIIMLLFLLFARLKYISYFVLTAISLQLSLEFTYRYISGVAISPVVLDAFFTTNISYTGRVIAPFILKAIIPFVVLVFLFIKVRKEVTKLPIQVFYSILFVFFLVSGYGIARGYIGRYVFISKLPATPTIKLIIKDDQLYVKRYPLLFGNLTYMISSLFNESLVLPANRPIIPGLKLQPKEQLKKIVIVIGESSALKHYSVYGYPYKTTPNLDKLHEGRKLIVFDKALTPVPMTDQALRFILSYSNMDEKNNFFKYKNITEMASVAGYKTYWISSTYEKGINASFSSLLAMSSAVFYDATTHKDLALEDDLLLADVLDQEYQPNSKQFFILHMQGSHTPYEHHFDEMDSKNISSPAEFSNYDATIYHTDRSLMKIIDVMLKYDESFVFYYFSDHGEIVNIGHGMASKDIAQYEVPLITYQNKTDLDVESIVSKYRSANGFINIVNTDYIISELLGFTVTERLVNEAKANGEYVLQLYKQNFIDPGQDSQFNVVKVQDYFDENP